MPISAVIHDNIVVIRMEDLIFSSSIKFSRPWPTSISNYILISNILKETKSCMAIDLVD
jgi:hypothetical protein